VSLLATVAMDQRGTSIENLCLILSGFNRFSALRCWYCGAVMTALITKGGVNAVISALVLGLVFLAVRNFGAIT